MSCKSRQEVSGIIRNHKRPDENWVVSGGSCS